VSTSPKRNRSVARAAALLRAVGERPGGAPAAELARATGLSPATAGRFLATLVEEGFLTRRPDDVYVAGLELARVARAADWTGALVDAARPELDRLAATVRETVTLSVVRADERDLDLVAQVDPPDLVVRSHWVGRRFPLHASAAGKLLLAELEHVPTPLARLTPATIVDPEALARELDAVRARGWAALVDELEEGLAALAAPVRDPGGRLVAALAVSGPSSRLDRMAALEPLLAAAAEIERLWSR